MLPLTTFYQNQKIFCAVAAGLSLVVGYLGLRLMQWLRTKLGTVKKVDDTSQKVMKQAPQAQKSLKKRLFLYLILPNRSFNILQRRVKKSL